MNLNDPGDLPIGFVMSLATDMKAMSQFGLLSDAEKKELISYIESSSTGDEAKERIKQIISSLHNQYS